MAKAKHAFPFTAWLPFYWTFLDIRLDMEVLDMSRLDTLVVTPSMVRQIASIDEFRGSWQALQSMPQEYLGRLLHVATIESIGSSTRIEGSRLSDEQVDAFLANLAATSFSSRDEQEVAGYADVMRMIFSSWTAMPLTEATVRQLHRLLLAHSPREDWHRGAYKTTSNAVAAFDANAQQVGMVFETADPFETPRLMTELVDWMPVFTTRSWSSACLWLPFSAFTHSRMETVA
jgi:Fic family protein